MAQDTAAGPNAGSRYSSLARDAGDPWLPANLAVVFPAAWAVLFVYMDGDHPLRLRP